jgi:hypothetical protein
MDNATMARLLEETADLLEIDGGDGLQIGGHAFTDAGNLKQARGVCGLGA